MPLDGHCYVALTLHAFKEKFCDYIESVICFYIAHLFTLDGKLITINPDFSFEKFVESGDELHDDIFPQILPQVRQSQRANSAGHSKDQKFTDGSDNSKF